MLRRCEQFGMSEIDVCMILFGSCLLWVLSIQKQFALSPRLFSLAMEMIGGVFMSVFPVDKVEILLICL